MQLDARLISTAPFQAAESSQEEAAVQIWQQVNQFENLFYVISTWSCIDAHCKPQFISLILTSWFVFQVLSLTGIGVLDDFYELGGTSILAARIAFFLQEKLGKIAL